MWKKAFPRLELRRNITTLGKYYECYVDSSSLLFMNEDTYTAVPHSQWGYCKTPQWVSETVGITEPYI